MATNGFPMIIDLRKALSGQNFWVLLEKKVSLALKKSQAHKRNEIWNCFHQQMFYPWYWLVFLGSKYLTCVWFKHIHIKFCKLFSLLFFFFSSTSFRSRCHMHTAVPESATDDSCCAGLELFWKIFRQIWLEIRWNRSILHQSNLPRSSSISFTFLLFPSYLFQPWLSVSCNPALNIKLPKKNKYETRCCQMVPFLLFSNCNESDIKWRHRATAQWCWARKHILCSE